MVRISLISAVKFNLAWCISVEASTMPGRIALVRFGFWFCEDITHKYYNRHVDFSIRTIQSGISKLAIQRNFIETPEIHCWNLVAGKSSLGWATISRIVEIIVGL